MPPFTKTEFETLSEFRYQLRCFLRRSEELTRDTGITNLQYLVLLHLKGFPGREWATIWELAEKLQAQHHGTVALVSRCELLGLVERQPGRQDGREVEVHLTPQGNKLIDRLARQHRDELIRLDGVFAVPGRRQLLRRNRRDGS